MEGMTINEILVATGGILLCGNKATKIEHISINSKEIKVNSLFVPLIGERVDAHQFIEQALSAGAVAVLTSQHQEKSSNVAWIRVENTKKALQEIGKYCRDRLNIPLIGITGSVGKTTTRQMIATALSAKYAVFQTPKNYNGQVGVPITLSEINPTAEIAVIELGISEPGEMTIIAQIAKVNVAVITNIGVTHLEQLKSRENIYREKLAILDGLQPGGVLFLNGDDVFLKTTILKPGYTTRFYGTGENCDYRAENIELLDGCPAFTVRRGAEEARVQLNVKGKHFVENALVAIAIAHYYGVSLIDAADRLAMMTEFNNRQKVYHNEYITVIDDAYNASPISMKAGLEVLRSMKNVNRKIAVLADMKELGEREREFHQEIGEYIASHAVDMVVTLGELGREIGIGIKKYTSDIVAYDFMEKDQLLEFLKLNLKTGDCVLLKGSNSMQLSSITDDLLRKGC